MSKRSVLVQVTCSNELDEDQSSRLQGQVFTTSEKLLFEKLNTPMFSNLFIMIDEIFDSIDVSYNYSLSLAWKKFRFAKFSSKIDRIV